MLFLIVISYLSSFRCEMCDPKFESKILPIDEPYTQFETEMINQDNLGFGIWFKWQPMSLIQHIQHISTTISLDECQDEFLYQLQSKQIPVTFFFLYLEIESFIIKIKSDIFWVDLNFPLEDYIEGVWIFYYTFFDFEQGQTTFFFYQTNSKQQTLYQIDDVPNMQGTILQHKVGGICENCVLENEEMCFSQFEGRLSNITKGNEVFNLENFDNIILECFSVVNDCIEQNSLILIENSTLSGKNYKFFESQVMEKQIYQLCGWFKLSYTQPFDGEIIIFKITNYYEESELSKNIAIIFKYIFSEDIESTELSLATNSYISPSEQSSSSSSRYSGKYSEIFKQWHYISFDIVDQNQAVLQIFSYFIEEEIKIEIASLQNTGMQNLMFIGGDLFSKQFFAGIISNLQYTSFCEFQEYTFIPKCHYTCETCYGPYLENCLTCSDENSRFLYNNQCICKKQYMDYNYQAKCQTIKQIFTMFTETEIEIQQNNYGYDYVDEKGNIVCSYGYFEFKNHCIKCPYYDLNEQSINIICLDCYLNPKTYYLQPKCTIDAVSFYNDKENVFEQTKRSQNSLEYFEIVQTDKVQYGLKLAVGFILEKDKLCKERYYKNNDECLACSFACLECSHYQKCIQCLKGYFLNQQFQCEKCENCEECEIKKDQVICQKCPEKYYLNEKNQCTQCGQFCGSCRSNKFCNYCEDQAKYYISLDGINCQTCDIENCKYCFQLNYNQDDYKIYYTTLDLQLEDSIYKFPKAEIYTLCGRCNEGYAIDAAQLTCVKTEEKNQKCILGTSDSCEVKEDSCKTIAKCATCGSYGRCAKCTPGYYSDFLTQRCVGCPTYCNSCSQQNIQQKDSWKWEIYIYYLMYLSGQYHEYEDYVMSKLRKDYELICVSCNEGYILYQGQCILGCQKGCQRCEIIDNLAQCVKCNPSEIGFPKYLDSDGQCQFCPTNCAACINRDNEDMNYLNQYFISNSDNSKYSKLCFYSYDSQSQDIKLSINQNIVVECDLFNKCKKIISFQWNLYCDENQFNTLGNNNQNQFGENYYIKSFFESDVLGQIQIPGLTNYINDKGFTQININLNLIQGTTQYCEFPSQVTLKSTFFSNVFILQNLNLNFFSSSQSLLNDFAIEMSGFSMITFSNLQFTSVRIKVSENQTKQINFKNCDIVKNLGAQKKQSFQVMSDNILSLYILNFNILNVNYVDQNMLKFQFNQNSQGTFNIEIVNLKIKQSQFQNSNFIFIDMVQKGQNAKVKIQDFEITDTNFTLSNLIQTEGEKSLFVGEMDFQNIKFSGINLINSKLFSLPNIQKATFLQIQIENSVFKDKSYMLLSNNFQCEDFIITNVNLAQSFLISNQVDLFYQISKDNTININLQKFKIEKVNYANSQSILQLIQYESCILILKIIQFKISKVFYVLQDLQNFISQELALMHINCQICEIDQLLIERENGLPEISILNSEKIKITNSIFTQNRNNLARVLHPSTFNCFSKNQLTYKFYYIFIGQYQEVIIDNLQIFDSIAINQPFIIMQGTDAMRNQISENIQIMNSVFQNNIMVISFNNSASSIIQVISDQKSSIIIQDTLFKDNHLNAYLQDLTVSSSTTILMQLKLGSIIVQNCNFSNNILTNSSDSILYLKADTVYILNSNFYQSNFLNFTDLSKKIIFEENAKTVNAQNLQQAFQIYSNGGSGYILASNIHFANLQINQSYSMQGGAFYVNALGDSKILIENSKFEKTYASLLSASNSFGGCFYIDAQVSRLTLIIKNATFDSSISRTKGGAFYLVPSNSYNNFLFQEIKIKDCFSIQSSFLDFTSKIFNTMAANFYFQSIFIHQTKKGFYYFLSLLDQFSKVESNYIVNLNPLFYIYTGNLTFQKCQFYTEANIYLIQIEQGANVNFSDVILDHGIIFPSPFIKINIESGYKRKVVFSNFQIKNIQEFSEKNVSSQCQEQMIVPSMNFSCLRPNFKGSWEINLIDDSEQKLNNKMICNQQILINTKKSNFSLIQVTNIEKENQIQLEQIVFESTSCSHCQYGLINLLNIEQTLTTNIEISEINIKNCTCGLTSCLTIIKDENSEYFSTSLLKGNRIMQQQNYEKVTQSVKLQAIIMESYFMYNVAKYGGSVCVIGIDILIKNSQFVKNKADIGGAIYYEKNNSQILLLSSKIIQNLAKIAGGIFLFDSQLQETQKLDVFLSDNNSTISGSDILENPRSLAISVDREKSNLLKQTVLNTSQTLIEKSYVQPYKILGYKEKVETLTFPSGQAIGSYSYFDLYTSSNIKYNLTFRILALNKFQQLETNLDGASCTLAYKIINQTDGIEMTDIQASLSYNKVNFSTETKDFNLDNLVIQFNPYYEKEIVFRLYITCDVIKIPIYDTHPPYPIAKFISDYKHFVDIRTFPCQLGEYFNSTAGICIQCDFLQSQYSVEQNATSCQFKDDSKIKTVQSQVIELKAHFWRAYFYSIKIEECYHFQQNCLGGWKPGDDSCTEGHIGALCEQCDLYNIRGNGYFSISQPYKCGNCDQISGNIVSVTLISLWTVISVLMSVNSTIETIQLFLIGNTLSIFKIRFVNKESSTAVLIKVFTNYLQIVQTIFTFQLKVPDGFSSSFNSVGNPIEQLAYSLDCFLTKISDITIIYFRIIWSLGMAMSYILTFFILLLGAVLLKKVEYNVSMVTTALIYIFIFLQPNLIQALISLVSFRVISDVAWIQGNVAYKYGSDQHKIWLLAFCLPMLISFSFIIPGLMYYRLRSQKNKLDSIKTRETWGYLYNEYKLQAYYWEFIKILQKEFIIIVLSYYEDHIAIKASLVFLFIFAYSYLTTTVSPYMTGKLNQLDILSTTVCAISIILASSIYTAQNSNLIEIVYPFYTIIAIINGFFLLKVITQIFFAYIDKLNEQIDKVKEMISSKLSQKLRDNPRVARLLETKKTKDKRIYARFDHIRQYLFSQARRILQLKKNQYVPSIQLIEPVIDTSVQKSQEPLQIKHQSKIQTQTRSLKNLDN